jgi:hypothetical protein
VVKEYKKANLQKRKENQESKKLRQLKVTDGIEKTLT